MVVGLTQRVLIHNGQAYDSTDHDWYRFFEGHALVFIPNLPEQDFAALADQLDCLIITGGDDSTVRRVTEIRIATEMLKRQKPIVGVCHGCFLLTELLGGKTGNIDNHHNTSHVVVVDGKQTQVNSFHSLCIVQEPATSEVLAQDTDGYCEAWIDGAIAGIVWHPERMDNPVLPKKIQDLLNV